MKFYNFFLLLWVIFALLDPDPIIIRIRSRNPGKHTEKRDRKSKKRRGEGGTGHALSSLGYLKLSNLLSGMRGEEGISRGNFPTSLHRGKDRGLNIKKRDNVHKIHSLSSAKSPKDKKSSKSGERISKRPLAKFTFI
jgi:hypothetical protein